MNIRDCTAALSFLSHALASPCRPLLVQLVVTRRCNLSCGYCNEYDKSSDPVSLVLLKDRIQKLAALRTHTVTCTGGEPLLHPDLDQIIAHIQRRGMRSSLTTNGYLLSANRIARLNKAGLRQIQISVDNLTPDRHSAKSLCVLDRQLKLLSIHADFSVNLNTVLGVSEETAEDVLTIADRARDYGFELSVSLMHNGSGSLAPLGQRQRQVYAEIGHRNRSISHFIYRRAFQQRLIDGLPLDWQCRAGARYMYICEHGLVHRCSQQRDHSGKALADYGWSDIQREYQTRKDCSRDCTINCVQLASAMDRWSGPQIFSDPQRAASKDPRSQT